MSVDRLFSYNIWILFKNNNKISTLIYLQNNIDVISRYGCNGNTHVHHVDPVFLRKFTCLFIDRIYIYKFHGHLIPSHIKRVVAECWEPWTCSLEAGVDGSNPTMDTIFFCNIHLFRVPRSCTGSVQMKSSMTFIRGNRCIEREKCNFKSREVKRLKECTLALTWICRTLQIQFELRWLKKGICGCCNSVWSWNFTGKGHFHDYLDLQPRSCFQKVAITIRHMNRPVFGANFQYRYVITGT